MKEIHFVIKYIRYLNVGLFQAIALYSWPGVKKENALSGRRSDHNFSISQEEENNSVTDYVCKAFGIIFYSWFKSYPHTR